VTVCLAVDMQPTKDMQSTAYQQYSINIQTYSREQKNGLNLASIMVLLHTQSLILDEIKMDSQNHAYKYKQCTLP
jgi:geranylgeranyl pyrophosphate synthase